MFRIKKRKPAQKVVPYRMGYEDHFTSLGSKHRLYILVRDVYSHIRRDRIKPTRRDNQRVRLECHKIVPGVDQKEDKGVEIFRSLRWAQR